ncbi:MAG: hypothetical protein ABS87_01000 [Sphingomonas sp. SCN 67-18]|nr:hypothetical protein [Sphingomonas sp. SCN 67-18]ODU22776.1 MAG: hypothetical protein ABS87_01000 [Sphingomonas sp. SCN 67-18]
MGSYSNPFPTGVSDDVFAVSPADAEGVTDGSVVRPTIRQLYVGTGGTLKYTSASGIVNTITIPDGFILQCAMRRVWQTGTSATNLLGYV